MRIESIAGSILAAAASIMIAGYALDAAGFPISPGLLAALALTAGTLSFRALGSLATTSGPPTRGELPLFIAVVGAFSSYLLWLGLPSLLPIADGPDIVHHLSLIHVIQRTHHLPGEALRPYLNEMMGYTPGSHILTAVVAEWLRVDALRIVFPLMVGFVALKAGLVYFVTLRILKSDQRAPVYAAAAPLLLLVPAEYFFGAILKFDFYAQVVSETFAIGMIAALVAWWTGARERGWLAAFAVCGVGAFLAWPVWVPPAVAAALVMIAMRRAPVLARVGDAAIVCVPIVIVGLLHAALRGGTSILGSSGAVTAPSIQTIGAIFIALTLGGALLSAARRQTWPVLVFAVMSVLQAFALAILNRQIGSTSLYLPYKMVYLVLLPCAIVAALALARISAALPVRGSLARAGVALLPAAAALALLNGRLATKRPYSPINAPAYAAGLWARAHVPHGCIDYFSQHWLTGYWLHLDVLGNPRVSDRMRAETFEFRDSVAKWIAGRGLPYGIVEHLTAIPNELHAEMIPMYRVGDTAVVRGSTSGGCADTTASIEQMETNGTR